MAIGFGIIGCGMISRFHAKAIADVRGAKLVACFDRSTERAAEFGEEVGCRSYESLKAMLADPAVDAVTVGTPSGVHLDPILAAAKAGKHVIVEKPLEITLRRCDRAISCLRKSRGQTGRHLSVAVPRLKRQHEAGH